jgi:phage terminase large subunit
MEKKIIIEYIPHEKQLRFHQSSAKYRLICTGIGFGKTAAGVCELIKQCVNSPAGVRFALAAPTYRMLTNATLAEFFKFCPRELIESYNKSDMIIDLVNGVEIVCVAGDRDDTIDRIRGITIGGFYGDEISRSSEYMHEVLVGRLRDGRGPMKGWYTTTPKGFNWLHRIFVEKRLKNGEPLSDPEDYEIFTGSTFDNPHTPDAYKQSVKNAYVGVFAKQELYGEFVGYEGLVYPGFHRDMHVIDTTNMPMKAVWGGVDFGFSNPSVILQVGEDYDGRLYIMKEFYESRITDSQLAGIAKSEFTNVEEYVADSENPSGIREFSNLGLNCRGIAKRQGERGENFVSWGIKKVAQRLEPQADGKPRLYVDRKCVNTITEFENYRYPEEKDEKPSQEAPIKIFDHALDALRYLVCHVDGQEGSFAILTDSDRTIWKRPPSVEFGF